jgi:crossover junction endodeoxyribonuclease RusA
MPVLAVFVCGLPRAQGSKRHVGGGVMAESSEFVKPWRSDIRAHLLSADGLPLARFDGAVHLDMEFVMTRPRSAPKRSEPPAIKRPDLDKLQRAVFDAVGSAGVWRDDSQVVSVRASKRLARIDEPLGLHLVIMEAK